MELPKPVEFPEWWAGRASVVIHYQPLSTTLVQATTVTGGGEERSCQKPTMREG